MKRIKIIQSAELSGVSLNVNERKAHIPFDGDFHPIDDYFLDALGDSEAEYEVEPEPGEPEEELGPDDDGSEADDPEIENDEARGAAASSGDADGLGGSSASLPSSDAPIVEGETPPAAELGQPE